MHVTMRRLGLTAALAVLTAAPPAWAAGLPRLDEALKTAGPEVVRFLQAGKYTAVGVLPFLARVGDGPLRDNLGPINRNLARRLEVAAVMALPDDRVLLLSNAGDAVVESGNRRANHRTPAGRREFFRIPEMYFHPAWGDKAARPDVFLTGEAALAADFKSLKVTLQAFDKEHPENLVKVGEFSAAADPRTLTEAGVSFTRAAKGEDEDEPVTKGPRYLPAPLVPESSRLENPEKVFDDLVRQSPVRLEVLVNGKPVRARAGVVPTPPPGTAVTFRLKNEGAETCGVVLKVNGINTIFREDTDDLECHKWVLEPGRSITVEGFQRDDTHHEAFLVQPPAESRGLSMQYGPYAGLISLVVYRGAQKEDEALVKNDEERMKNYLAIARGSVATRGARPASLDGLKGELEGELRSNAARDRGLIIPGAVGETEIKRVSFTPYPRPVVSLSIRYYEPK